MKILIIIEYAKLGGHVLSSLTIAKELEKNGYQVVFAGGKGNYAKEIQSHFEYNEIEFFPLHAGRQTYFNFKTLRTVKSIITLCTEQRVDLIHAFDAKSYVVAALASIFKLRIPYTCTLCGGTNPYYNIPFTTKMIVFSEEQREKMIKKYKWDNDNISIIRNRIDMNQFHESAEEDNLPALLHEYLTDNKFKIIMITNFFGIKKRAVMDALQAVDLLLAGGKDVRLILIGQRGEYFEELKLTGERINSKHGCEGVIFAGYLQDAYRVLKYADAVLGVGRSAFEGMAYNKPALVVGERGYAGVVCREKIAELEYYNFSGRNNNEAKSYRELAHVIVNIMEHPGGFKQEIDFAREYLETEIAVTGGIERIMSIYQSVIKDFPGVSRIKKITNLIYVLIPILFDNYYNAAKKLLLQGIK